MGMIPGAEDSVWTVRPNTIPWGHRAAHGLHNAHRAQTAEIELDVFGVG